MVIRYEANPPKILPGIDLQESLSGFIERIKSISDSCDAIHLTENVLGFQRESPIVVGRIIKKEIPNFPITTSLRVRDKTEKEIQVFVDECIETGFSGILVLMGDPSKDGRPDTNQIPSQIVKKLHAWGIESKIDLYLSISNRPNYGKITKKVEANPKGFVTQVIQSVEQVKDMVSNLSDFSVIPIVLFPSEKNKRSAEFLGVNFTSYGGNFKGFVGQIHDITGDLLITSPNDFTGLKNFLRQSGLCKM